MAFELVFLYLVTRHVHMYGSIKWGLVGVAFELVFLYLVTRHVHMYGSIKWGLVGVAFELVFLYLVTRHEEPLYTCVLIHCHCVLPFSDK